MAEITKKELEQSVAKEVNSSLTAVFKSVMPDITKNTKEQVLEQVQKLTSGISWKTKVLKSGPRKGLEIFDECCYDIADAFVIGKAHFIEKKSIAK